MALKRDNRLEFRLIDVTGKFALFRLEYPFFEPKKRYPWTLNLSLDMMRAPISRIEAELSFSKPFLDSARSS